MAGNSFGKIFTLTTFGESHGGAIGGVIDGCPAGVEIDFDFIRKEMDRRKPGQSHITTQRKESDTVEFLSGIFNNKTLGTPIGFIIRNEDGNENDYSHLKDVYRPSHADFTYDAKYGERDYRGGGRSSARETACRVVAGAFAKIILKHHGISISSYVSEVGDIKLLKDYHHLDLSKTENNIVRCPDELLAETMIHRIEQVRKEGDTIGGVVSCVISGCPAGLGEPVFDKLHADLGKAMLSINAVKGFEYGSGFEGTKMKGSEHNDSPLPQPLSTGEGSSAQAASTNAEKKHLTKTNHSGGIQGGISNGEDIYFRVAFKPVSTIMQTQTTINTKGEAVEMQGKGRHDPCVLPRAVPVVEAMCALVVVDHLLRQRNSKL